MASELAKLFVTLGLDDKEFQKNLKGVEANIKATSKIMAGVGAGITAALGLAVKAAAEEEAGIQKLSVAMTNVGLSYENSKGSLEEWINTQQQKTSVADNEQRESLASLITMTGSLGKSQEMLTLAMDMSVGTGRDLTASTQTLGYALAGNWGMVNRMIPALADVQGEEAKWAFLREKFAGQAEKYSQTLAGQFELLKNNVGDVVEQIGGALLPVITDIAKSIQPLIENLKEWIEDNPGLVKGVVTVAGAVGGLLLVVGSLGLALPAIAAGIAALLGPVGWVSLAITALVAVVVGVSGAFKDNTHDIREELAKQRELIEAEAEAEKDALDAALDKKLKDLRDYYGLVEAEVEKSADSQIEKARKLSAELKKDLDASLDVDRRIHTERMSLLDTEYAAKLRNLNAETAAAISAIQDQIEAIDSQTDAENRIIAQGEYEKRRQELLTTIESAGLQSEKTRLTKELTGLETEWKRSQLLLQRDDEKSALRERMEEIRTAAEEQRTKLQEDLEEARRIETEKFEAFEERTEKSKDLLDQQLEETKAIYTADYDAAVEKEGNITQNLKTEVEQRRRIREEELNFENNLSHERAPLPGGAAGHAKEKPDYTLPFDPFRPMSPIPQFASGGIVTRPTLALIGESGPEAVVPLNRAGGGSVINISFNEPVFLDREESVNNIADKIYDRIKQLQRWDLGVARG